MHVGKTCIDEICSNLYVDGWVMKNVTEVETGKKKLEDEYSGLHVMVDVKSETYLGDILSMDGRNVKNINARKNRGTGIVTQLMMKLEEICIGKH